MDKEKETLIMLLTLLKQTRKIRDTNIVVIDDISLESFEFVIRQAMECILDK